MIYFIGGLENSRSTGKALNEKGHWSSRKGKIRPLRNY